MDESCFGILHEIFKHFVFLIAFVQKTLYRLDLTSSNDFVPFPGFYRFDYSSLFAELFDTGTAYSFHDLLSSDFLLSFPYFIGHLLPSLIRKFRIFLVLLPFLFVRLAVKCLVQFLLKLFLYPNILKNDTFFFVHFSIFPFFPQLFFSCVLVQWIY